MNDDGKQRPQTHRNEQGTDKYRNGLWYTHLSVWFYYAFANQETYNYSAYQADICYKN